MFLRKESENLKICFIGNYGSKGNRNNGQTIKTKIVTDNIIRYFKDADFAVVDTHGGGKRLFISFFMCLKYAFKYRTIVMMPGRKGLSFFAPLLSIIKRPMHLKIHYVVIGGWLTEYIRKHHIIAKFIYKIDFIYVEINSIMESLRQLGYEHVYVMPNFKDIKIINKNELRVKKIPFQLCTFSRVMKEKGIELAIDAISKINQKNRKVLFQLDIYGQVEKSYQKRFETIMKKVPEWIKYKGIVEYDKSSEVLKKYDLMMFPTYYEGEGFPGTLIDAFAAGLPVIASDWKYNPEILKNGVLGYLFKSQNLNDLIDKLIKSINNPKEIMAMSINCLVEANKYTPNNCIQVLVDNIEDKQ